MTRLFVLLGLLSLACGRVCADRVGDYAVTQTRRTGNCVPSVSYSMTLNGGRPSAPAAPCTGTLGYSDDYCGSDAKVTCPKDNGATSVHMNETLDWSADGESGSGTMETTLSGATSCTSTYDITYTKK